MENGVCYHHGGKTPKGIACTQFKTGRYSKYLPARLSGRYEEAISDPELLALKDDIGLLDTRISAVVAALDTGESREAWSAVFALWNQIESEWQTFLDEGESTDDLERSFASMSDLIRRGMSEGYVWSEIRGLLKERVSLVGAEQKRLVEMQQYVTATQAMGFVASVMASVRRHVSDRRALAAISSDLTGLSLRSGSGTA